MKMTVLGRGPIFQSVVLACTYNNDTMITLQKKSTLQKGGGGGGGGTERGRLERGTGKERGDRQREREKESESE